MGELHAMIDELTAYKNKSLQQQSDQLVAYKQTISQCKERYETLINDANLDIHKRKYEIMQMMATVIDGNKCALTLATQPELKIVLPAKAISAFLNALSIDACDSPSAPLMILEKISFDTMTVSWSTEFDLQMIAVSNRKAQEYQLCYAKFQKEFILSKKQRKKAKKSRCKK